MTSIASSAEAAANSSVGKALLHPAAQAIGGYWGERAREWTDKCREKRRENVAKHIQVVEDVTGKNAFETDTDAEATSEWLNGAAEIDPDEDRALAEVWQAALVALQSGGLKRKRILRVAKELEADEAAAFLALKDFHLNRSFLSRIRRLSPPVGLLPYRKRLLELGLVRPISLGFGRYWPVILLTLLVAFVEYVGLDYPLRFERISAKQNPPYILDYFRLLLAQPINFLLCILGAGIVGTLISAYLGAVRMPISDDGRHLAELLDMVSKAGNSESQNAAEIVA